ncbi:hypothetical protein CONPUDRAFT_146904 [Coniophora puteana RWD-64-598 SS2]|uniref:Uncharacterized protein n=1 Tax=Coniophora puteana (strain RWD-64-598) TaxID=741705 RepID=A0A5M3M967_CONPW|nr:uncharacterized protein CONPUDRAFT_146904 [Coniophora puteana RWD-64-598 SS2]EIW75758.1 hypothetical protein CONPUDRAFT_146904 [Coniophora puteana RWD-64-598 SS2]
MARSVIAEGDTQPTHLMKRAEQESEGRVTVNVAQPLDCTREVDVSSVTCLLRAKLGKIDYKSWDNRETCNGAVVFGEEAATGWVRWYWMVDALETLAKLQHGMSSSPKERVRTMPAANMPTPTRWGRRDALAAEAKRRRGHQREEQQRGGTCREREDESYVEIDHEVRSINAQVDSLQRREDELARILQDMQRLHAAVQAEKRSLLQQRVQLESQKQPINWLPSELLSRIFYHVLWQDPASDNDSCFSVQRNTFYPDTIVLSQVCSLWRQIALSTSRLWSYIPYRTRRWCPNVLGMSLERARSSPIDLIYAVRSRDVCAKANAQEEVRTGKELLKTVIRPYSHRLRSLHVTFHEMVGMDAVVTTLSSLDFPMLEHCEFIVPPTNHRYFLSKTSALNFLHHSTPCRFDSLTSIRVQRVPLRCFSRHTLVNLRKLYLSFPAQGSLLPTDELLRFLTHSPQLEDLTLDDVWLTWAHSSTTTSSTDPHADSLLDATLPMLHRLTWRAAAAANVSSLMSSLHIPRLQSWDLTVLPASKRNINSHNFTVPLSQPQGRPPTSDPLEGIHTLSALTDLTVQCHDAEGLKGVLRKFGFPALERLELGFLDPNPGAKLVLPRADSLFRDPRLPTVTHLTLTDFALEGERAYRRAAGNGHGDGYGSEVEDEDMAMLRYMPNLVSLTLVSCASAGVLLHELARTCTGGSPAAGPDEGPGVRACPKLEEVTLMSCQDVSFGDVYRIAHLRSRKPYQGSAAANMNVDGSGSGGVPRSDIHSADPGLSNSNGKEAAIGDAPPSPDPSALLQRKIVPLRRSLRRAAQNTSNPYHGEVAAQAAVGAGPTPTMMFSMSEALNPAKLARVYIDDCPLVMKGDAAALEGMGVMVSYS